MDFSDALRALKEGAKISRDNWNAGGQWVCLSPGFTLGADRVFATPIRDHIEASGGAATFRPYMMLRTADGSFVPWQPTGSDVLADDWRTVVNATMNVVLPAPVVQN